MVEDNFLLYMFEEGVSPGPSRLILMQELPVASGDPFISVEGFRTARIGLFRTCWNATYNQSPEGQVIIDAD